MSKSKKVFIAGCFDLFHDGHKFLLEQAAKLGQVYISLDSDAKVRNNKGIGRPIDDILKRSKNLKDTGLVYDIYVHEDNEELTQIICLLEPEYIMVGSDYKPEQVVGRKEMQAWGGSIVIIPRIEGISTSKIIEDADKTKQ